MGSYKKYYKYVPLLLFLAGVLVGLCTGCGSSYNNEGLTLREEIEQDVGITDSMSDLEVAHRIREYIYVHNILPEGADTPIDVSKDFYEYYQQWKRGEAQWVCGGLSYLYGWMLEQVGIPARGVQLATQNFLDGTTNLETHVTNEIFVDGRWINSDPTFNVDFQCEGEPTDTIGLKDCYDTGKEVTWDPGVQLDDKNTVDNYPIPFEDHLAAYAIGHWYKSTLLPSPVVSFPYEGWDE